MSAKQFYFLGEPISSARGVDVGSTSDLDELKNLIAAHFAIVEPSGNSHLLPVCGQMTDRYRHRFPSA